jgi:hypothetical protein
VRTIKAALCLYVALVACGSKPAQYPPYCYESERFTALILACTPKSKTREESRECKRQLNESCGFVETVSKNAHE